MTETAKQRFNRIRHIKNIGILESHGWNCLLNDLPPNSGGDSEYPFISNEINFIVNNAAHDLDGATLLGVLFIGWAGELSIHYCSLSHGDDNLKIDDTDLLDDIFWKSAEFPTLNHLEA